MFICLCEIGSGSNLVKYTFFILTVFITPAPLSEKYLVYQSRFQEPEELSVGHTNLPPGGNRVHDQKPIPNHMGAARLRQMVYKSFYVTCSQAVLS